MSSRTNNYPVSVPSIISEVVTAVGTAKLAELQEYDSTIQGVYFMQGNMREIVNVLAEKSNNSTQRFQKFPVFILVEDIPIDRRDSNSSYYGTANMRLIIANHTKPEYKSAQREAINFENILRPLYNEFLYQLSVHKGFSVQHEIKIPHRVTERKFWGADDNTNNVLGDYIDAIEITDLSLKVKWYYCQTIINESY